MKTEQKCPTCGGTQRLTAETWFGVCGNVWHLPYFFKKREQQDLINNALEERQNQRESERKNFDGSGFGVFSNLNTNDSCVILKFFTPHTEDAMQFFNEEVEDFKNDDGLFTLDLKIIRYNPSFISQYDYENILNKYHVFQTLEEKHAVLC